MASQVFNGQELLGTQLQALLMADGIVPGQKPGYQLCKTIYCAHPHGAKLVDFPIQMALYKPRTITVPAAPDEGAMLVEAFWAKWKEIQADRHIFNLGRLARVYGTSTLGLMVKDADTGTAVDFGVLSKKQIAFNVWDPLNTSGSLVLNQDPNAMDFQKVPTSGVLVNGQLYHPSRTVTLMNEDPLYIEYESAGFGFVGRSVYQRGLVPLKSFVLTLATDMMIALKAGVLIAKMESQSSAVDAPQSFLFGTKRSMVKEAQTGNVISIGITEEIESLNLQNLDGAYGMARKNIIENEAASCGTPAKIILSETFAEGFGEGTEDAKAIAQYIESVRTWLDPAYVFMDPIVMALAWDENFFERVRAKYPDAYPSVTYETAFREWSNSFTAQWPNLLDEPESEKLKGDKVILEAIISTVELLLPELPQEEKARVIEWMQNQLNEKKRLFSATLDLDIEAIATYEPPAPMAGGEGADQEAKPPKPKGLTADSGSRLKRSRVESINDLDREIQRKARAALSIVHGESPDRMLEAV